RRLQGATAQDQYRDIQRQDQQRQQQATALEADRQCRPYRAQQAQHRRTQQQRAQQHGQAVGRQAEHQRQQWCQQYQRQPGKDPVRQHLGQHQQRQRVRRQYPLLQRAVLEIAAKQAVQREQHGQERRDPDQPR